MRIKMLTLDAGPGGVRRPGQVYEVPDKEAQELINGGFAEKVERAANSDQEPIKKNGPRTGSRGKASQAVKKEGEEPAAGAQ